MKVLYIHHNPDKGGSSNSLRYLLEEMPSDIDIHISSPTGVAFDRFKNVTKNVYPSSIPPILFTTSGVKLAWLRILLSAKNIRSFNKEIEKTLDLVKPDLVHLNEIGLISVAQFCKSKGYKVVMHARIVPNEKYKFFTKYCSRIINKCVDHLICIDGSVSYALPDVKSKSIVYNPLQIRETSIEKNSHDGLNVFFLASFLKHKGIFDVLQTAIKLKSNPDIKFLIAGGNLKSDSFFSSPLGKLLGILGIYPNIQKRILASIKKHELKNIVLLGYLENINDALASADVLLLPTHMNEPSRSVFEAGIHGVPTVLTLKDKVEDLVEDGVTGVLLDQGDINGIANALLKLKENPSFVQELGENSRKRYSRLNDRQNAVNRVCLVYNSIINGKTVDLPVQ